MVAANSRRSDPKRIVHIGGAIAFRRRNFLSRHAQICRRQLHAVEAA
jgi:hypothetical protein